MKSVKNLIVPSIILLFLAVFAIVYFAVDSFRSRNTIETDTDSVKIVSYESSAGGRFQNSACSEG